MTDVIDKIAVYFTALIIGGFTGLGYFAYLDFAGVEYFVHANISGLAPVFWSCSMATMVGVVITSMYIRAEDSKK